MICSFSISTLSVIFWFIWLAFFALSALRKLVRSEMLSDSFSKMLRNDFSCGTISRGASRDC